MAIFSARQNADFARQNQQRLCDHMVHALHGDIKLVLPEHSHIDACDDKVACRPRNTHCLFLREDLVVLLAAGVHHFMNLLSSCPKQPSSWYRKVTRVKLRNRLPPATMRPMIRMELHLVPYPCVTYRPRSLICWKFSSVRSLYMECCCSRWSVDP
jgi:hypothetical protein